LVDFDETLLVRYFGNDGEVTIRSDVTSISTGCFSPCDSILAATLGRGSRVSIVGESAFSNCSSVQSICFPSSIEIISNECFSDCPILSNPICESGCRFRRLINVPPKCVRNFHKSHLNSVVPSGFFPTSASRVCANLTFGPSCEISVPGNSACVGCSLT
jgi:hypothetical protein